MARVFISYARKDVSVAQLVAERLAASHEVWWDRHIQGGSRFAAEIDRALQDAEVVVVLWTESSVQSAWVQDEAGEGRDSGRLLPVTVNGTKPPLGFRQFQAVALTAAAEGLADESIAELLSAIERTGRGHRLPSVAQSGTASAMARTKPAICVLPFANMSGDIDQEYFSDGITEDIIIDLSKVSSLSVVARNTSFTFKGKSVDVPQLCRQLGTTHVLEGSVRKAGNRVRIAAQLIDGEAGDHSWAERWDRSLEDIFAVQDEISLAVVSAVKLNLLAGEKRAIRQRGTSNSDAYNLYLMARQQYATGNQGDPRRDEAIIRLCNKATEADPSYGRAWALMALAMTSLHFRFGRQGDGGLEAAERALQLDPELAEAHSVKARHLSEQGHPEDAMVEVKAALALDPESYEVNLGAGYVYFRAHLFAEAIRHYETAAAIMDTDYHSAGTLLSCYTAVGDREGERRAAQMTIARAEIAVAQDQANGSAIGFAVVALAMLGEAERARAWIERALLLDPDNLNMRYSFACALCLHLNDQEGALDLMEPVLGSTTITWLNHVKVDPDLDCLRGHPRFKAMLRRAEDRLAVARP